jgi:proteic killer suppression protein
MIRSFRSKALRRYAETGDWSKLSVPNINRLTQILARLDGVETPQDMNLPGWRFHAPERKDEGAICGRCQWQLAADIRLGRQ